MSDFESKINIDIDAGGALAAIKALQTKISDFHSSLAKGSATANIKSLQMQQTLIDTINSTGQFSAQMKTVASSTQTFTTALEKNKLSMGQYFKYAGGASKSFSRFFRTEMDTIQKVAIERVKDLQTQYIKMGRDANGAIKTIAVRPLALDMKNLSTQTQIAAQKQQLLNQLLKQGSTNLLNFGKNTQWAGRQLMVGFTIPLGILGTTAARTFMDMEKQAIAFKRVYGDTFTASKETDAMLKQVQQLASEFTKYGVAVEKTMEQAAKAAATGKMGADLLAQVSEATRLSVLGNVDQQQALETTISLTNAFGTAADELRGKINFLNAVENQTITSIEDLTTAIPKAAPVIQQLGGNVEDLTFFLTAMREGGINASESANALKSGLASLINPTRKASDFLQSFGININSIVEGNKGDVKGLVIDFAKALDTLDPLNRARAIEQLFGKFQFSRLSTLFQNVIKDGSQAARVLELTRQSSAELGILAQRELNRIAASPMYKFEKAIADFKKELAPVGEEFLKAVTPIINFATDVLKAFNNLDGGVKQFIINSTGLIAGIGPVFLMTFGLLANGIANIIKGFTFVKNVFNKTASASTILGETTDYMTQQQLEAATVAASLEQVHNKLTQAFTSEARAVANLTAAYQKAVGAQVAFTGPAPAGKRAAKPKKYANGVFSVPGPKGAGDVVPAMLSPGEAVIPAKPAQKYRGFIKGMIAGNIPGFEVGTDGLDRAHLQGKLDIKDPAVRAQIEKKVPGFFKLPKDVQDRMFFSGSLTADLPKILNQKLKTRGGGVSPQDFLQTWSQSTGKLLGTAKMGGADIADVKVKEAIQKLEDDIGKAAVKIAEKAGTKVTDVTLGRATSQVLSSKSKDSAATKQAKEALLARAGTLGDYRTNYTNAELQKLVQSGRAVVKGTQVIDTASGIQIGRVKSGGNLGQKPIPVSGGYARQAKMATKVDSQSATESKKNNKAKAQNTKAVKENTAAVKKETNTKKAATKTTEKASQSKTTATPTVTVTESLGNGVTREVDGNGKERFRINGRYANPQKAMALASGAGAATKPGGRVRGILTGIPGKLGIGALATMGVGAATGNKQISSISDQLFQAAMLASFVPQETWSKMGKGIKGSTKLQALKGKFDATKMGGRFAEAGSAAKTFKLDAAASVASKGLMKSFPMLAKGASMVALRFLNVIPVVGQVALALEILYSVATINAKKQQEISEAIVETLTMTKEKLDKVNEFFGSDAKLSGIRTATVASAGQGGREASLAEQFRQSEQFQSLYKPQAEKLKDASKKQFMFTMQSLGLDLYAQGMSEEQVQIIIDAIKKEAGQTDLVIKFKDLKLDTEAGKANFSKAVQEIGAEVTKQFQSNRDFLGINWEAQSKLDELESQIAGFMSATSQEFVNGRMSAQEFTATSNEMYLSMVKMEQANPGDGLNFLNDVIGRLNPELQKALAFIDSLSTKSELLDLARMGIQLPQQLINDLARDENDITANTWIKDARTWATEKNKKLSKTQKIVDGISNQQENLQDQEQNINDIYDKRIKALERINQLQDQMSKQKQNQLDLADALSRGDVFAAAQAMQKIRADQAALAVEQQKNALEDERDKKTKAINDKQEAAQDGLSSAQKDLSKIQASTFDKSYDSTLKAPDFEEVYKTFGFVYRMSRPDLWFSSDENVKVAMKGNFSSLFGAIGAVGNTGLMGPLGKLIGVAGNFVPKKANGGYISGPGSGTSDSIPARLSNGEYVIRAKAVNALGTDVLDKMNHAEKFAKGGMVRGYAPGGPVVKKDISYPDPGIGWFNSFVQDLLGGGNPTGFMQNDYTKNMFVSAYNDSAWKLIDPTNPLTYLGLLPGGAFAKLGLAGKGISKSFSKSFTKPFTGVGSNKELNKIVSSTFTRNNVKVGEDVYPTYNVGKGKFAFQGYGQELPGVLSATGTKVVPTTPEGLLEAAIGLNPKNKKLKVMLKNFKENKIGQAELDFLDNIHASVSINKKGKATEFERADGLATMLSALSGNKTAKGIVDFKTQKLKDIVSAADARKAGIFETYDKNTVYGDGQIATPANVPFVRSLQGPLDFDKKGNALIYSASNFRNDYARSSIHGTADAIVSSHSGGGWDPMATKIVSPLSEMIRANGLPRSMDVADTWWLRNPGQPLVLPKGAYSQIRSFDSNRKLSAELVKRGIIKPGATVPIISSDPTTKEVFRLVKANVEDYTQAQKELLLSQHGQGLLPGYSISDTLDMIALDVAKKQHGIVTGYQGSLNEDIFSNTARTQEISNLATSLGVRSSGSKAHSSSSEAVSERSIYARGNNNKTAELERRVSGIDALELIRTVARLGHFKGQVINPRLIENRTDKMYGFGKGVTNFAKGGLVKRSSDQGLDWFNSFIQNLLGGGNPSAAMQNDATKSLLAQSYTQGAKNMGVDPTDPMFYASMFAPSMGIKALGVAGKGVSKLKGLQSPKTMTGFKNYLPDAYVSFMRSNPRIAVRMQSEKFMDALNRKDFAYRNIHQLDQAKNNGIKPANKGHKFFLEYTAQKEAAERLQIEENVFGIPKNAPGSARPIYGAAVNTNVPWGIRGRQSSDAKTAKDILKGNYSNVSGSNLDRYGDISLLLKKRVNKRSTFTLGDTYSSKNFRGQNVSVPAPFGTMNRSKILGADTETYDNDLKFVEAQIFGGLPFSDIKKIIVRRPELIAPLRESLAQSGLKIPVGESKLSPLAKFVKMLNLKHKETGKPLFYKTFNEPYDIPQFKTGGMFRTSYANGGLAMLHDKEFVMNAGAVKDYGVNNLKAMNNGTYTGGSVYNSYGVNINVGGSNSNANDIARTVIREIKRIDSQNIRSTKV